jgi:hypothetical protein
MPKRYSHSMRKLKIKRFKLDRIPLQSLVQIVGPRGNGKSMLMQEFCYENRDRFDEVYAWSYTDWMNLELEEFIPRQHIHHRFKERDMTKIIQKQEQEWRRYKWNLKHGRPATPGKEICFLLDDCAFKGDIWSTEVMNKLFYNGRHAHVTLVFVTQDAADLCKNMRGQVDVVFATRELTKVNVKTLHDNYFGIFDLPRDFRRTFNQLTQDYQMLVLAKNLTRSTDLEELVFWYKANIHLPPFRMGSAEAWAESDKHCEDEDPELQARKDENLVRQKVAEAIAAKQPIHQVVQCDTHGRAIDPRKARRKKQESRRKRKHRSSRVTYSTIPAGMARFERSGGTYGVPVEMANGGGAPSNSTREVSYHNQSCRPGYMVGF